MGKSLTYYTNVFFQIILKRMINFKMVESNSIEGNSIESIEHNSIDTSNLNNQQFRLNKINEIEDYFTAEIKERELMSKKLNKYIYFLIL